MTQVEELREEARRKEQRWQSNVSRLRDRIDGLEQENSELKDEVRLLEKRRLETWQQKETKSRTSAAPAASGHATHSSHSHKKVKSSSVTDVFSIGS